MSIPSSVTWIEYCRCKCRQNDGPPSPHQWTAARKGKEHGEEVGEEGKKKTNDQDHVCTPLYCLTESRYL